MYSHIVLVIKDMALPKDYDARKEKAYRMRKINYTNCIISIAFNDNRYNEMLLMLLILQFVIAVFYTVGAY